MTIIYAPEVYSAGRKPLIYGSNGEVPDGPYQAGIAGYTAMIACRRGYELFSKWNGNATAFTAGTTICRFQSGARFTNAEALIFYGVTNSSTAHGTATWTVDGVAQPVITLGANTTAPAGPGSYYVARQEWSNIDAAGNATLTLSANARVYGAAVYTLPSSFYDNSSSKLTDVNENAIGGTITGSSMSGVANQIKTYWERAQHLIRWSDVTGAGVTQTGATYKNVTDATTTGYAAAASGFWAIPEKRGKLNATTIPVTMWCYASASTANGKVRFVNSAGTIGTISVTGGAGWYTTTGTLDPTLTSSDLVIIEHANTTGGAATVTTHSAGMYETA